MLLVPPILNAGKSGQLVKLLYVTVTFNVEVKQNKGKQVLESVLALCRQLTAALSIYIHQLGIQVSASPEITPQRGLRSGIFIYSI